MSIHTRLPAAEMSTLKTISIVLAFTAAVGMVLGTAGFSAIDADRGIEVGVVDDEEAYLSSEAVGPLVENESSSAVVYENRFGNDLDDFEVHATATDPDVDVHVSDAPDSLNAGESTAVEVTVASDGVAPESADIRFTATASGDGMSVDTTRSVELDLISPGDALEVEFRGGGNAEIRGPDNVFPLDVEVDTTDGEIVTISITSSGEMIRGGDVTGQIQTVRIPEFGIERENPQI